MDCSSPTSALQAQKAYINPFRKRGQFNGIISNICFLYKTFLLNNLFAAWEKPKSIDIRPPTKACGLGHRFTNKAPAGSGRFFTYSVMNSPLPSDIALLGLQGYPFRTVSLIAYFRIRVRIRMAGSVGPTSSDGARRTGGVQLFIPHLPPGGSRTRGKRLAPKGGHREGIAREAGLSLPWSTTHVAHPPTAHPACTALQDPALTFQVRLLVVRRPPRVGIFLPLFSNADQVSYLRLGHPRPSCRGPEAP